MVPDIAWNPFEIKALREARHFSQRTFAKHLGYAPSTVANWEKPGRHTALHHETREVLNRELDGLSEEHRDRFDRRLSALPGKLGTSSTTRTAQLLDTLISDADSPLPYQPPTDVVDEFRGFLASSARVFLLEGTTGTGKSRLTHHLAGQFVEADIQLFTVTSWDLASTDVAVDILRYASIPRGQDALLTLEEHCQQLLRPCVVVIDGISSQEEFTLVGRQVDVILRQVTTPSLRFLVTVRTPPGVETTAHPLLHAALFTETDTPGGASRIKLPPWTPAMARTQWDQARTPQAPPFDRLPHGIQQLVRTPVYMQLAITASLAHPGHDLNAYTLLDHCVRTILSADTAEPEPVFAALTALAHSRNQYAPNLATPTDRPSPPTPLPQGVATAIVRDSPHGRIEFTHDVLREFFLSTRIAELLSGSGRSSATVTAINDLAARSSTSGTVRSILELVFQRLDDLSPDLLEYISTAPTTSTTSTLPLLVAMADRSRFATPEVLRVVAKRAEHETSVNLAKALLGSQAVHSALGHERTNWLLALLRRFGTTIWGEATDFVECTFDAADAYALLDAADLANGDEAIFFARHVNLFFADTAHTALDSFLGHPNWRVRAALAEGIGDGHAAIDGSRQIVMKRLVHDADYKVRAAVAPTITRAPDPVAEHYLATLLHDDNWYVRERTLRGLELLGPGHPGQHLIQSALAIINDDQSWQRCPRHIRSGWQRLQILNLSPALGNADDDHSALLTVLREARTGHLALPPSLRQVVVDRAQRSSSWLVRQEANRISKDTSTASNPDDPRFSRERFRRIRDHRAVQIALDMRDIDDAITVARAAANAGADFIEIGDPLIKEVGIHGIERVKAAVPDATIVAEMMSADWGRDQVLLAAQAGADIVLLIGPATIASVSAAVDAGQRLGVPILLDTPIATNHQWITDMERAGVDGFTVTTNIDLGIGSTTALDAARTLRSWTQLPIAVSGGFSATDHTAFASRDWDILIIGRSVADAVDPATAATHIVELAHRTERRP